ncbi:MAG: hypothetical protein V1875_02540 [Candidatus Altiarchaeota archaeon]
MAVEAFVFLRSMLAYFAALFLVSSSALAVHEFSHIYAAQYITKDCIFTETVLRFDALVIRRSGMTYFTCSHGVSRLNPPTLSLVWDDITMPTVRIVAAKPAGIPQITSPLTTGWFTALFGPAAEVAFVAFITDWLTRASKRFKGAWVFFLPLLVIIYWGSWSDFARASPSGSSGLFEASYTLAFIVIGMLHISFNFECYKRVVDL